MKDTGLGLLCKVSRKCVVEEGVGLGLSSVPWIGRQIEHTFPPILQIRKLRLCTQQGWTQRRTPEAGSAFQAGSLCYSAQWGPPPLADAASAPHPLTAFSLDAPPARPFPAHPLWTESFSRPRASAWKPRPSPTRAPPILSRVLPLPARAGSLPAPPLSLTPQPPGHARPQSQHLVHVRADCPLQGRKQSVLFRLEGPETRRSPGQDGSVDCVQELPGQAEWTPREPGGRGRETET